MRRVKSMVFLSLLFGASLSFAQDSTIYDMFPLKVWSKWTYKFGGIYNEWEGPINYCIYSDTGTVNFEVISRIQNDTAIVWKLQQTDSMRRREFNIGNTTYLYKNSHIFEIVEYKSGMHSLRTNCTGYNCNFNKNTQDYPIWSFPETATTPDASLDYLLDGIKRFSNTLPDLTIKESVGPFYEVHSGVAVLRGNYQIDMKHSIGITKRFSYIYSTPGNTGKQNRWEATLLEIVAKTERSEKSIDNFTLNQNYPNPFNSQTAINFDINNSSHVKLIIYDILGREIETLMDKNISTGNYTLYWQPKNNPSGVYFARLISNYSIKTIKLIYLR